MKIIDVLQKNNNKILPVEIPNIGREDLPQFFIDMGFKVGAEIGVENGYFSESLCKAGFKIYAIDLWPDCNPYKENARGQEPTNLCYENTKKRLAPYDCTIIRKGSLDAVKDFADESLDFVYIDGGHDFRNIADDISEWYKKIKRGGVISGHDYIIIDRPHDLIHVKFVVDAYTQAYKINPWYVLGRKNKIEGEVRDRSRSWMWIKK